MEILARSLRRHTAQAVGQRCWFNAAVLARRDLDIAPFSLIFSTHFSSVPHPSTSPLSLDVKHRKRMAEDLQVMSTPTASRLIKGMWQGAGESRVGSPPPQAAVLIPLCHVQGVPSLAFVNRPRDLHIKSLSFPTQMFDDSDASMAVTGLRAGFKELGVIPAKIQILGTQQEARDAADKVTIVPVVGYIGEVDPAKLRPGHDKSEVCSIVTQPLEQLLSPSCLTYYDVDQPPWVSPLFSFDQGSTNIFGLPAMLLHGALRVVVGRNREYMDILYRPFMEAAERAKMQDNLATSK